MSVCKDYHMLKYVCSVNKFSHFLPRAFRGRTPEWYNKAFGHLCAAEAARIRNSFQPIHADGPETKI